MNKVEIPQRNISIEFPSQLEEMNEAQFVFFVSQLLSCISGDITLEVFKTNMIMKFLNIRYDRHWKELSKEDKESAIGEISRIAELMDSFFVTEMRNERLVKVFKLDFVKNFIPVICHKYHGPTDALTDITFCEYRSAHNYFNAYLKSGSDDDLNHLIAVLYRPKRKFLWILKHFPWFDGNEKIRFCAKSNPFYLEKRVKRIRKLPLCVRYGIYLFFSGCEEFLATGSPVIDGNLVNLSVLYEKSEGSGDNQGIGLYGVLCTLSESKVFGSLEETDNQNLYDILLRLYQVVMQMKQNTKPNGSS